jgi:hypothetical protein
MRAGILADDHAPAAADSEHAAPMPLRLGVLARAAIRDLVKAAGRAPEAHVSPIPPMRQIIRQCAALTGITESLL